MYIGLSLVLLLLSLFSLILSLVPRSFYSYFIARHYIPRSLLLMFIVHRSFHSLFSIYRSLLSLLPSIVYRSSLFYRSSLIRYYLSTLHYPSTSLSSLYLLLVLLASFPYTFIARSSLFYRSSLLSILTLSYQ